MNSDKLTTIILTAIFSVLAKESVTWLLDRAKRISPSDSIKSRMRQLFNWTLVSLLVDIALIWLNSTLLYIEVTLNEPVTRKAAFSIVSFFAMDIYWLAHLERDLYQYLRGFFESK